LNSLRLYLKLLGISILGQMQYPGSFLMLSLAQFLVTIIEFVGIWALFERFDTIQGWTLGQVAFFYATVNISFPLADTLARGFDLFGQDFVKTGNFDRVLLRPRTSILQLAGYQLPLHRIGRLFQGFVVLGIAVHLTDFQWTTALSLWFIWTILGGIAFFFAVFVLQATMAFWTVESLEIANTMTYGGVQAAQYPMDIYAGWFRKLMTFVVPLACISYFPVVGILGLEDPLGSSLVFQIASPAIGFLFLFVSFGVWQLGVRHYTSTGS
jgi:viologen exporter family transport system permease protein